MIQVKLPSARCATSGRSPGSAPARSSSLFPDRRGARPPRPRASRVRDAPACLARRPGRGRRNPGGHGHRARRGAPGSRGGSGVPAPSVHARAPSLHPPALAPLRPSPPGLARASPPPRPPSAARAFGPALTGSARRARRPQQEDPQQRARDPAVRAGHGSGAPRPLRRKRCGPWCGAAASGAQAWHHRAALRSTPPRSPACGRVVPGSALRHRSSSWPDLSPPLSPPPLPASAPASAARDAGTCRHLPGLGLPSQG